MSSVVEQLAERERQSVADAEQAYNEAVMMVFYEEPIELDTLAERAAAVGRTAADIRKDVGKLHKAASDAQEAAEVEAIKATLPGLQTRLNEIDAEMKAYEQQWRIRRDATVIEFNDARDRIQAHHNKVSETIREKLQPRQRDLDLLTVQYSWAHTRHSRAVDHLQSAERQLLRAKERGDKFAIESAEQEVRVQTGKRDDTAAEMARIEATRKHIEQKAGV